MRWLFHLFVTMAIAAGAAYGLFFVDLGGQNLFSHLTEVWRSPVVQRKVDVVGQSIEKRLVEKLVQSRKQSAAAGQTARAGNDEVSPSDRQSLDELVGKIAHSNN